MIGARSSCFHDLLCNIMQFVKTFYKNTLESCFVSIGIVKFQWDHLVRKYFGMEHYSRAVAIFCLGLNEK